MDPERRLEISVLMSNFNDHELLRIVALEESEFLPEAIEIARQELEARNIKPLTSTGYFAQFPAEDPSSGFCQSCLDQTTSEEPGEFGIRNLLGPRILGFDHECSNCGSLLVEKWYCIVFPIRKMAEYRVLYKKAHWLLGREQVYRRVKEPDA
jgi:hypothetical protein